MLLANYMLVYDPLEPQRVCKTGIMMVRAAVARNKAPPRELALLSALEMSSAESTRLALGVCTCTEPCSRRWAR